MSVNAQQGGSAQQAQTSDGVVNTAPGETAPKPVDYVQLMNQLTELEKKINSPNATDAEIDAMKSKIASIEAEVAKKATKRNLAKKIGDLQKQLQEGDGDGNDDGDQAESAEDAGSKAGSAEGAGKKPTGKGVIANEEEHLLPSANSALNSGWFNDILKARKKLVGMQ
jgi:hypothetical protein